MIILQNAVLRVNVVVTLQCRRAKHQRMRSSISAAELRGCLLHHGGGVVLSYISIYTRHYI